MLDVERLQFLDLYSFELRLDYFEKILELQVLLILSIG